MKIKAFLWTISCLFLLSAIAQGQTKVFEFEDGLCSYKGYYDSKKYTHKQLADTYFLFSSGHYVSDEGTLAELTAAYDSAIHEVKALQVLDDTYFQELRLVVLRYLEETYALKKVEKTAKVDPAKLVSAVQEGTAAHKYALALYKGGEALLVAYEALVKERMKNNGAPERVWAAYSQNMRQANKLDLAFEEVLVYGWWNSANQLVHHIDYDGSQLEKFLTLFQKVETECDEA